MLRNKCRKCALEATCTKTRSPEWRLQQSKRLKKSWKDPTSSFNEKRYREELSAAQVDRWKNASEVEKELWRSSLRNGWSNSEPSRLLSIKAAGRDPINVEKRRLGQIKNWANNPERHVKQSTLASERMLDPTYKERCTRRFIEAAQKTGGTSKQELLLAPVLALCGYIHKHRLGKWYVDFYNPTSDTVVEYFGDWWHCHPCQHKRINERYAGIHPNHMKTIAVVLNEDNKRIEHIRKLCSNVIIVWENDITLASKFMPELVMTFIKKEVS